MNPKSKKIIKTIYYYFISIAADVGCWLSLVVVPLMMLYATGNADADTAVIVIVTIIVTTITITITINDLMMVNTMMISLRHRFAGEQRRDCRCHRVVVGWVHMDSRRLVCRAPQVPA